jgi:diadenosine tetraphosphate (Ap4A) HIT family hydrolase
VARIVRLTLSELFKPDMFNWASLGNLSAQCHLHVIPRYSSKRVFSDLTFEDKNWGKNYAPYDYEFHTPEAVLGVIRFAIKQVLDRDKSNDRYLKPPGDSKMREAWDALGKRFSK